MENSYKNEYYEALVDLDNKNMGELVEDIMGVEVNNSTKAKRLVTTGFYRQVEPDELNEILSTIDRVFDNLQLKTH